MDDLKAYRISTREEYLAFLVSGGEAFKDYFLTLSSVLDALPKGKYFDIRKEIPQKAWAKFVKACCVYIIEKSWGGGIVFTEDYYYLIRTNSIQEVKQTEASYQAIRRRKYSIEISSDTPNKG